MKCQQLVEKVHRIKVSSLGERNILGDWKKANIAPIKKGRDTEKHCGITGGKLTDCTSGPRNA